jgi:hypothetical protein
MVVPGVAAALVLFRPGRLRLHLLVGLAVPLGYVVVAGSAYLLMVLHVLRRPFFIGTVVIVTGVLLVLAVRGSRLRRHLTALLWEVRADPWTPAVAILVLTGIALVRLRFYPALPSVPAHFRYWADAAEIASAGRLPEFTLHYGGLYPPASSKVLLDAFNAGTSLVVPSAALALSGLLWVGSVAVPAALWAMGRELGLRRTAPLLAVLASANVVVLNTEMTRDMLAYRGEMFGRMVAFAAVALAIRALRRGRPPDGLIAGLLLAAGAATHLIPVVIAAALIAWYALATLLAGEPIRKVAVQGFTVAAVALLVGGTVLLVPRGDIGFQGAGAPSRYVALGEEFDPTLYLHTGRLAPPRKGTTWYVGPERVVTSYISDSLGLPPKGAADGAATVLRVLVPVGTLAVAVAIALWLPRRLRPNGVAAWGLGLTLVSVGLYFSWRYDVFILGTFGVRRMFDYGSLPFILLGLTAVEGGLLLLGRLRSWAPVVAGALTVLAASVLIVPRNVPPADQAGHQAALVRFLDWVRTDTPCEARVLADERTVGVLKVMTGRTGVVEGMGPYLRPDMLADVVPLLLEARAFFADPQGGPAFLQEQQVDFVVTFPGLTIGHALPLGRHDSSALARVDFLVPVYAESGVQAYRVVDQAATSSALPAGLLPCHREPIDV